MLKQIKGQFDITSPEEYIAKLKILEKEVEELSAAFGEVWTYCPGCMQSRGIRYAPVKEAYTEKTENGRTVLRCGKCHSILKFLD